jgi:exodeoxyribonuclease VII large subunit
MAVPVRLDLLDRLDKCGGALTRAMMRYLDEGRIHLQGLVRGIPRLDMIVAQKTQDLDGLAERLAHGPEKLIQRRKEDLVALGARLNLDRFRQDIGRHDRDVKGFAERLGGGWTRLLRDKDTRVETLEARLESVSPKRVLERGYAIVWDANGAPVTQAQDVSAGDALKVEFAGERKVDVTVTGAGSAAPPKPRASKRAKPAPEQGTLL